MTDGNRTVDLAWVVHNGTDVYYGTLGSPWKDSYHASGKRHMKSAHGDLAEIESHLPLEEFVGQLQLCTFGFPRDIVKDKSTADFTGKKGDATLYLDARCLPEYINVSVGFLEPGNYSAILPMHLVCEFLQLVLITSTNPWVYLTVVDPSSLNPRIVDGTEQ